MWKLLNFKMDKRTLYNVLKFPFIVLLTVLLACMLIALEWIVDWSDIINDKLPRWEP